jgi:ABC-type multidrug transport system fused ATPase/permease subunit
MGDAIGKIIEELVELFKRNYKRPKLWLSIAIILFIVVLLIPYIDSNFFYFSRMEKRINVLDKVMALDQEKINSNQAYIDEYQRILQEMEQQSERSINSLMNKFIIQVNYITSMGKGEGNRPIKFLSGAFWLLLITAFIPFMDTFKKRSDKLIAFVLLLIMSGIIGWFFSIVPVIISPMVNYIGVPLLQIIVVIIISVKSNKKKMKT